MNNDVNLVDRTLFDQYILVAPGSDYGKAMWADIELLDNGIVLDNAIRQVNRFLTLLHHIHFSFTVNRVVQLPFQSIWKRYYSMEEIRLEPEKRYCIIFTDISAARTDRNYLKRLGATPNILLVLVMVNTMARRGSLIEKRMGYFARVYSFDRKDCEKYGFTYHPAIYSTTQIETTNAIQDDAFYVGVSKGRAKTISSVYERLTGAGAKAAFYICGLEKNIKRHAGIHYEEWLSYSQVLTRIKSCNCIVEIMDGNQEGVTLRTMEAICYNKKLLTNNRSIMGSKYYQTGGIQVFEDPDKIDVNFVMRREKVDYSYAGEFSPVRLIEHINEDFTGNNKN